jgi:hypothetical protein
MNRWLPTVLCVAFMVAWASPLRAEETPEKRLEASNQAYFDGRFADAALGYESLLDEVGAAPGLLYNLGGCAYNQEKLGRALYYFERAGRTGDGEVREKAERNRETTRKALAARHKKKIEKGIYRYDDSHGIWYSLLTLTPLGLSLTLFLLFAVPLLAALAVWTFARNRTTAVVARILFLSLFVPAMVAGALYFGRVWVETQVRLGVVVAAEGQLHDAPDAAAPSTPLPEGLEVRVLLRNEQGFYKVELSDGSTGYASTDTVWEL